MRNQKVLPYFSHVQNIMSPTQNSDELVSSSALHLHTAAAEVVIISPFLLTNKNILEHVFTSHYVFICSKLIIEQPPQQPLFFSLAVMDSFNKLAIYRMHARLIYSFSE